MSRIGKVVWGLHWVALIATPIWWTAASSFTGGGWGTLALELLAVPTFLLMLIGPITGVANRRLRAAQTVPKYYAIVTIIAWVFGAILPLTIASQGDTTSGPSWLGSLGVPEGVATAVAGLSVPAFFIFLIAGIITLFVTLSSVGPTGLAAKSSTSTDVSSTGVDAAGIPLIPPAPGGTTSTAPGEKS